MTEEIIIDCAFYKDGVCASPINKTCEYCKNIDVSKCYHKQLKRLEQENNSLQAQLNNITVQSNNAITALEQENKELKEIINKSARSFCNDYLKTFEENKFLNKQIMEVKFNAQQEIEFLTEENNTYRSALEEIKEVASFHTTGADNEDVQNDMQVIIDKINEYLGE